MRRLGLIVSAAVVFVVASSQAQATFTVIRWPSGLCQIVDNALPIKPFPSNYKAVSRNYKTFDKALAKQMKMSGKGCW